MSYDSATIMLFLNILSYSSFFSLSPGFSSFLRSDFFSIFLLLLLLGASLRFGLRHTHTLLHIDVVKKKKKKERAGREMQFSLLQFPPFFTEDSEGKSHAERNILQRRRH